MSAPKLTAQDRAMVATLKGKTIARVALYPFDPMRHGKADDYATSPVITFTDGTSLRFVVEETEGSEYGVALVLRDKRRKVAPSSGAERGYTPAIPPRADHTGRGMALTQAGRLALEKGSTR
jgi:hypothetical protein